MKKMLKKINYLIFSTTLMFLSILNVQALTGTVNVNNSLTLRNAPTTSGTVITKFYNGTVLTILDTNTGSGNGCSGNWYKVEYGSYQGYSCGDYIILNTSPSSNTEDNSYSKTNYDKALNHDGSIMCYEDTGSLGLRSSAGGNRTGKTVNCGEEVDILETVDKPNTTCPYWYKIKKDNDIGYVCGYYVNTTKLSSTAQTYYNNKANKDTIDSYKQTLTKADFPESYHSYLLELHARHPNWNFIAEKLSMNFDDAVIGESGNGANLLQGSNNAFDKGYFSTASNSYNLWTDIFYEYESEPGYYNASQEAIAYYMDPRNYLNEKYIFTFETLEYSSNQSKEIVAGIISNQKFFNDIYTKSFNDGTGSASGDIVTASSTVGISATHVASRIKQEISGISTGDSRIGGNFTYNGISYSGYYNFFNIKCFDCKYQYAGYAFEKGWNTPYKGILGGANFMYNDYISLNQDTIYYEKFDVSTSDGHYTHQYMQNLAAPIQEGGIKYNGYVNNLASYLNTNITFVIPVYNNMPNYAVTAPKLGSPNNYLKSLTINGNSVSNFSYNTYNYNVYLNKNTTSVTIAADTITSSAKVNGSGSITINSNNQTNQVIVTSESGKTRIYTINFIREETEPTTINEAMQHSGFKYNDKYLFGINVGTNVSQIIGNISNFNHSVNVVVKDMSGNIKNNDGFKTGDQVTITGSDGEKTYTAVIYGDVNGDGKISAVDYMKVKNYIMNTGTLSGGYLTAADINKDGKVTAVDYMKIKNNIMGRSTIEQ